MFYVTLIPANSPAHYFFKRFINIYIACDKECAMATRVPNPISLYYNIHEKKGYRITFPLI